MVRTWQSLQYFESLQCECHVFKHKAFLSSSHSCVFLILLLFSVHKVTGPGEIQEIEASGLGQAKRHGPNIIASPVTSPWSTFCVTHQDYIILEHSSISMAPSEDCILLPLGMFSQCLTVGDKIRSLSPDLSVQPRGYT